MNNKPRTIAISIAVIVIILIGIGIYHRNSQAPIVTEKDGMKTYIESDFGFSVTFPNDWIFEDRLTGNTCCLFIAHWMTSTTTAPNASGTPVETVTQKELIKLQIGAYDKKIADPFTASTTQITLNGKTFYTGYTPTGEYFLLARDGQTGIGAAEFRYLETPQADMEAAKKIVGSLTFVGKPKATMQPISTSTAETSKKK